MREHAVRVAPPLHDEVAALPADLVRAFNDHVAALAATTITPYGSRTCLGLDGTAGLSPLSAARAAATPSFAHRAVRACC